MKKILHSTFYIPHSSPAFTLAETIIAIAVIALVITTAYSLSQSSIRIGRNSMNQFIAYHLSEEGLEVARNLRDSNWLQNKQWRVGLEDGEYEVTANFFGSPQILQKIKTIIDKPNVILSESEKFKRVVKINSVGEAMRVESIVYYKYGVNEKEISLAMELTDWKKGPL
ncbi:hypothetical protein HZC21_01220 [Candidatus Peregrinibacteria bacterium]|nr:hypothetical protein [Candidatus Peregrinibacteria bacterium]